MHTLDHRYYSLSGSNALGKVYVVSLCSTFITELLNVEHLRNNLLSSPAPEPAGINRKYKKGDLKEFRLSNDDQFNKTFQRASNFVGTKEKFPASVSGIKFQGA